MKKFFVAIFAICLLFSSSFAVEGTNRTIKVNKVVDDDISEKGEVDYFNFSLSSPGSLQIRFEFDIAGSYTVKLINKDTGKTVQTNTFKSDVNTISGRAEKTGNKLRLDEGDYQLQVSCSWLAICDEEYELEVIFDKEDSDRYEKEPNNDAKNAMIIDYNRNIIGNLESKSDVDYYMVEIPTHGELYTQLKFDASFSYNVQVYSEVNGSLKSLQSKKYEAKLNQNSDEYSDASEVLRVSEGVYYFKVSKNWNDYSDKDYTFSVRFSGNTYGNYEIENNNDARNANEITSNVEFVGNLNSSSDVDYYRLSVWNANKFTIKMNVPDGASYNVVTYKEVNGELSKIKSETFTAKELSNLAIGAEQEISAGEYYFKVSSKKYSNKDYTFLVETNDYNTNNSNNNAKTTIVLEIGNPYMLINNKTQAIDGNRGTAPVILNSRTMLPIRAVIEALGGNVTWVDAANGININLGGKNVYLTLNSALAYVNGEERWLDVAPTSINARTMVPVKFVMDNLGGSVIWNATTGTVTITY